MRTTRSHRPDPEYDALLATGADDATLAAWWLRRELEAGRGDPLGAAVEDE